MACNLHNRAHFCEKIETKGQQPYVLITTTHTPKYLDQLLTVLHATFIIGYVYVFPHPPTFCPCLLGVAIINTFIWWAVFTLHIWVLLFTFCNVNIYMQSFNGHKFPQEPYSTKTETETRKWTQTEIYCLRMHKKMNLTLKFRHNGVNFDVAFHDYQNSSKCS